MNKKELLKNCFELLRLDERATQTEVELAYETLTKDKDIPTSVFQSYRQAFEYIMAELFMPVEKYEECTEEELTEEELTEEDYQIIQHILPPQVIKAYEIIDKNSKGLISDKAKLFFATQNVNLAVLLASISESSFFNLFGIKLWNQKDISKAIHESFINNLEYRDIHFELHCGTCALYSDIKNVRTYVKNLQRIYKKSPMCKVFDIENTSTGAMGYLIADVSIVESVKNLLVAKGNQNKCYVSISTNLDI